MSSKAMSLKGNVLKYSAKTERKWTKVKILSNRMKLKNTNSDEL